MKKSPEAFRTISEVAEWLDTPAHVLRFWESRFGQIKPVKRAGGRRYYRPSDMRLLGGIKKLLHEDGVTIRGVQKILREKGVKHVAALSPAVNGAEGQDQPETTDTRPAAPAQPVAPATAPAPSPATAGHAAENEAPELPFAQPAPARPAEPAAPPPVTETTAPAMAAIPADPEDDGAEPAQAIPAFLKRVRSTPETLAELDPSRRAQVTDLYRRLKALRDRMSEDAARG